MTAADFFSRWRVRIGYFLAVVVLFLARPTPRSILLGAAVGLVGLAIRAYSAGYLHKQEVLTTTGPYAYTRNPLYLGSSILAVAAALAMHSWLAAVLVLVYFAVVYTFVMRREEIELREKHGAVFDAYAAAVPLFFPRLTPRSLPGGAGGAFSWAQYKRNHEYEAPAGFLLFLILLAVFWHWRAL
ncbi:MAG: isoprenylcysteine carboxylmethyltransferase family protein [Candidatus Acidiferrum sp.]|jgi:protein-S-isoprenylcysteine O-methyltransferase Ste14